MHLVATPASTQKYASLPGTALARNAPCCDARLWPEMRLVRQFGLAQASDPAIDRESAAPSILSSQFIVRTVSIVECLYERPKCFIQFLSTISRGHLSLAIILHYVPMMAVAQAVATSTEISFFGTCPTGWNNLNTAQKASCIGFNLKGRIGDYFGWAAAGELRDQWNKVGFKEYDAVIKCHRSRHRIYPPEIRLLSISSDQSSAYPFVIIICSREKAGKDTIARLELHPRLSRFGLRYLSRLSNTVMTMDKREGMASDSPLIMDRNMAGLATTPGHFSHFEIATPRVKHEQEPGYFPFTVDVGSSASGKGEDSRVISSSAKNLCGAKIAVYSGSASFRNPKRNSSTIGSVLKAGNRYFALTVAHVFFGDVDTNKSWFDSGLSLNSQLNHTSRDSSNPGHNEVRDPQISESYEIVIESLWPHHSDLQDGPGISRSAIGRVSPRITHQRRLPDAEVFPELLLDAQLDWALIELRDPSLWESNTLAASDGREVNLTLSNANISPPNDEVLIAAGTSGEVRGKCLGTVGGIMLPWSSSELHTWSVEAEIGETALW